MPVMAMGMMPKCPACVAGYILLWTGLSLSLSVAAVLRSSLIAACVAMLIWMIVRRIMRPRSGPGTTGG
jgi:high-affinity Fe2+/Pb2+ permease